MPPTPTKGYRRGGGQELERNRKNRLNEKALSFHGKIPAEMPEARIRRPKTLPDLLAGKNLPATVPDVRPKLTKVLLNVTVQGSVGAVQVLMSLESTVGELIAAAIQQYMKEGRRSIIANDSSRFDLHYSQFSLESLDRDEKLMALGSRNFFLCPKKSGMDGASCSRGGGLTTTSSPSCSKEVKEEAAKSGFHPWLKFMDFLL
ncbi:hypothetical protein POPTR_009G149200v4 [Populus trichocarpa]|uniref:Uncharacterized protein n=1 Tax=Populus trichocarpa TaxID=3694 RepID=A0ACC0SIA6_POPTR|nr:uncharacterized protein At4g22758 [Populus trichocarpa]XP_052311531.1 uncharacterized protein At4g22758 [Populus trichocarpa]KAI5577710.1 hypothetical protein BDE02_09G132700 [Populus trichocarpa]KAI9388988.1 hypothetical protein POPTR_009G149200v4 [Populus trichocarpa]